MSDPLTPDEIRATYDLIQTVARMATLVDLKAARAIVHEMNMVDSVMPILDPTGWMKIQKTAPAHNRLAQAFLNFRTILEEFRPDE